MLKLMPSAESELPGVKFVQENPTLLSPLYAANQLPLMNYLSVKTIVDLTTTPFIISDNPVIKYDKWMEKRALSNGATGIAVKGLQIFLPIHPRMIICLYDDSIYKCGQKNKPIVATELDARKTAFANFTSR